VSAPQPDFIGEIGANGFAEDCGAPPATAQPSTAIAKHKIARVEGIVS
jgi:hypothetical protein